MVESVLLDGVTIRHLKQLQKSNNGEKGFVFLARGYKCERLRHVGTNWHLLFYFYLFIFNFLRKHIFVWTWKPSLSH